MVELPSFIALFVAGLIMFLAPCTFPLVPGYLAMISGVGYKDLADHEEAKHARGKVLANGSAFVLGFSVIFISFGLLVGLLGTQFGSVRIWLTVLSGLFVILFGYGMLHAKWARVVGVLTLALGVGIIWNRLGTEVFFSLRNTVLLLITISGIGVISIKQLLDISEVEDSSKSGLSDSESILSEGSESRDSLSEEKSIRDTQTIFKSLRALLMSSTNIFAMNKQLQVPENFKRGKPATSLLMGMAFGTGWTPCAGPALGAALGLTASQGTAWQGASMLAVFSLGLAVPFMIIAATSEWVLGYITKMQKALGVIHSIGGWFFMFLGVLLLTNQILLLSSWSFQFFEFLGLEFILEYL